MIEICLKIGGHHNCLYLMLLSYTSIFLKGATTISIMTLSKNTFGVSYKGTLTITTLDTECCYTECCYAEASHTKYILF